MPADPRAGDLLLAIEPWRAEFSAFVAGEMSIESFVDFYDRVYRSDDTMWTTAVFDQLDGLWAAADDYEPDPELRPHVYRSTEPAELRGQVRSLLETAGYDVPDSAE